MLKFYVSIACVVLFSTSFSQTNESKETIVSTHKKELQTEKRSEELPSLEEQGFKLVIIGDKKIYRKEVNGIIVEFTPEVK